MVSSRSKMKVLKGCTVLAPPLFLNIVNDKIKEMEERFVIQNYEIIDGDKYPMYYGSNYTMYENMQYAKRYETKEYAEEDFKYVSENCEGITEIIPVLQNEKTFRIELK